MRNINIADPLQIAFFRALAFLFSITFVLIHKYRLEIVTKIKNTGFSGLAGGFLLMLANLLFIQALANTSIANALFTLSSIPFITAILAFVCAICFSGFVIVLRKSRNIDMLPANIVSGILVIIVSFVVTLGNMKVPIQEILLCFLWG